MNPLVQTQMLLRKPDQTLVESRLRALLVVLDLSPAQIQIRIQDWVLLVPRATLVSVPVLDWARHNAAPQCPLSLGIELPPTHDAPQ